MDIADDALGNMEWSGLVAYAGIICGGFECDIFRGDKSEWDCVDGAERANWSVEFRLVELGTGRFCGGGNK
ncbi:MAG: hypothetical protein JETCAE01_33340 [Anaerolineaceae bacterium]|nr:MAG: hypothetical protein JETCAE01_33340 [Anaerolineaceae bacterium]